MPRLFQIKICGVTHIDDVGLVADAGADAIGLNFFPGSKRYMDPVEAIEIAQRAPASLMKVGVFVNEEVGSMQTIARMVGLDWIQLHGDERPEVIDQLQETAAVLKAFRLNESGLERVIEFLQQCKANHRLPDAVLLDAYHPAHFGGTGITLDWNQLARQIPLLGGLKWALAGGLTPDNVARAIAQSQPAAVDTASGVEATLGRKDATLTRSFVDRARAAFRRLA